MIIKTICLKANSFQRNQLKSKSCVARRILFSSFNPRKLSIKYRIGKYSDLLTIFRPSPLIIQKVIIKIWKQLNEITAAGQFRIHTGFQFNFSRTISMRKPLRRRRQYSIFDKKISFQTKKATIDTGPQLMVQLYSRVRYEVGLLGGFYSLQAKNSRKALL